MTLSPSDTADHYDCIFQRLQICVPATYYESIHYCNISLLEQVQKRSVIVEII